MSDDRMDRAERIRNMREGNRSTDDDRTDAAEASTETDESATAGSTPETEDSTPSAAGTDDSDGASGFTSLTDDGPEPTDGGGTAERSAAAERAAEAAEAVASTAQSREETTSTDAANEAQAAAQRAAASAAEVMGTGDAAGGDQTTAPTDTGAVSGTPAGGGAVPGNVDGVELPDQELLEEAMATSSVESTEGGARAAMEGESTQSEEVVRVLEFSLGDEYYCLDIEYVEEIVKRDTVTRVPNTPNFVDGVVDLRGQITTILEPKEMMTIDSEGEQNLIIVFDPEQFEEQGAIGWVVDEVRQVVPVTESEINTPPVDADYINGVVDREEYDQFVIWVEPEDALTQATATDKE